jgi:hypothetical protein
MQLHVEHALASGDWAVVELHSLATAKDGLRFDNCWVCRFRDGKSALGFAVMPQIPAGYGIRSSAHK